MATRAIRGMDKQSIRYSANDTPRKVNHNELKVDVTFSASQEQSDLSDS